MTQIEEINWNNFKAKFNGKEQKSFENLCYLVFCSEFNQRKGIFRYKNQTGSETDPIETCGEVITWQAKFLETKISTKKEELKQSIEATKRKNPSVTKILFYLNQEFSESSKKDKKEPAYKTEIEDYAKSKGVKIEWRVPSHFERQLALDDNRALAQHFFSLGKSVVDFITELHQHTQLILAPIHSEIIFGAYGIKIDRSSTLRNLQTAIANSSLAILSGEGGTGKTAVIKELYDQYKETIPFFVFKASEFNIQHINDLFGHYGDFNFSDFIAEHQDMNEKYIVIDSAEKLSDIENQAVFQEFLSRLLQSKWKIIFTTRRSYLDDLKWQLVEIYNHSFSVIDIENIHKEELYRMSGNYEFILPQNERFLELLLNPFYLNEYLQSYNNAKDSASNSDFKRLIWNKKIQNSLYRKNNIHLERERYFIEIAKKRADSGSFYVSVENLNDDALKALASDEVIKYDSDNGGYFITQDTYEEWALEKIIERSFNNTGNYTEFFSSLGSTLPIRRAFRSWLSERLLMNPSEVKPLIEESITSDLIEKYWKDEAMVSVLLSDYAEAFFQTFEKALLEDNEKLLMRVAFLLRIACKEIDEDMLRLLGLQYAERIALKTVFTVPKGKGWDLAIDFIHRHKEEFSLRNMAIILPLLNDWNNKKTEGETTKKASQIALFYYEDIFARGGFGYTSRNETRGQLIRVILQGAGEINGELTSIFNNVIAEGKLSRREKYHDIVKTILTSIIDGSQAVKTLPEHVIRLADLFWFKIAPKGYSNTRMDIEEDFCIADNFEFRYFPASALQTPIYLLLKASPEATMDFIVSFTNKTVECFIKSELGNKTEEVTIFLDDGKTLRQYICDRLWNTYRGTQVSTELLESIHMALEKWLLEQAKNMSQETLEAICKKLISNSKSASITAVVASVVLAYPDKLFNVAQMLFRTKEFFLYDSTRMFLDLQQKNQLLILKSQFPRNYESQIYEDERIRACDAEHRKFSLEYIAFQYQLVRFQDDAEFEKRRRSIWEIWDEYYKKLPPESEQSEKDKTWRLFLARMDARKMTAKAEPREDGKNIITFIPKMDPELKKYSEDSLQESNQAMKYTVLNLWSGYRFKGEEDKYKQYQKYESDPRLAASEAQEILKGLEKETGDGFSFLNRSTLVYTCAVLIRDFSDQLTDQEKEFCKNVIVQFASIPLLAGRYSYQILDGTEPSIYSLPQLMKLFPEERNDIKALLFFLLLNPWPQISSFATCAVLHYLWEIDFDAAQSIFLGYLTLQPKYENLVDEIRKKNYKKKVHEVSREEILKKFEKQYGKELEKVISNKITYEDVGDLTQVSLKTLQTGFELLPLKTNNKVHSMFISAILPIFSQKILIDGRRQDKIDYKLKNRFIEKLAYFVLTSTKEKIEIHMKTFVDNFTVSEDMADLFQEFVSAEDKLNQYEEFWVVWNIFYKKVVEICEPGKSYYYSSQIIHNYLLAWPWWKEGVREWHTLKERERIFLAKVVQEMGHCTSVLYSLAKLLNDIGSNFLEDGIFWISGMLQRNQNLLSDELETNTIYYMENLIRRYIITNRQMIKRTNKVKLAVIVILNFLVERGSITGYLLREDIL